MRTQIERHAEDPGVGDAAPADAIGGLDHNIAPASGGQPPRRCDTSRARTDDDRLGFTRSRRRAERRRRQNGAGASQERSAAE